MITYDDDQMNQITVISSMQNHPSENWKDVQQFTQKKTYLLQLLPLIAIFMTEVSCSS